MLDLTAANTNFSHYQCQHNTSDICKFIFHGFSTLNATATLVRRFFSTYPFLNCKSIIEWASILDLFQFICIFHFHQWMTQFLFKYGVIDLGQPSLDKTRFTCMHVVGHVFLYSLFQGHFMGMFALWLCGDGDIVKMFYITKIIVLVCSFK